MRLNCKTCKSIKIKITIIAKKTNNNNKCHRINKIKH